MKKVFIQNLFLKKIARKHYIVLGAAILVITVTHFVLQLSFIQTKNLQVTEDLQVVETSVENVEPGEQTVVNKEQRFDAKEYKTKKTKNTFAPKTVKAIVQRQPEREPPTPRILPKKRVFGESRAARLRRAEKILTGV